MSLNNSIENILKELKIFKEFEFLIENFKELLKKKTEEDKIIFILKSEIDDIKNSLSSKSQELESLKITEKTLKKEAQEKSIIIIDLQNEVNDSKSKFFQMKSEFERELNNLNNSNENLKKSLLEAEKCVETLKNDIKDKTDKDKQMLNDSDKLTKLTKYFEVEVNKLNTIIKGMKNEEK